MRPIRLDLHGFAAFREPTVVDFAGVEYFALVGPTGSGKSTVIDAMTFALYGSVPRWDDRRTVGLALAPTANRGTVQLLFEVGGVRYLAARELRRAASGRVTVKNARLERLLDPADPNGDTEVLAADSDVSKHVEDLLGLPFEQFCVCVVLPQGDFAEFLHAKPAERQETLTRILGLGIYKTIAQRAGTEATTQRLRAETLGEQLTGYAGATESAVADSRRHVDELAALVERVAESLPVLAAARARVTEAERVCERTRTEAEVLAGVRAPEGLAGLATRAGEAAGLIAEAREALAGAEREDTEARELLAAAPDPRPLQQVRRDHSELGRLGSELPGLADQLTRATTAVEQSRSGTAAAAAELETARAALDTASTGLDGVRAEARRLDSERELLAAVRVPAAVAPLVQHRTTAANRLADARRAVQDAEHNELRAREQLAVAVAAESDARRRLDEVVHADQVSALRSGLAAGDACPVCEQRVHTLPTATGTGDLPAARAALRDAAAEVERLKKAGVAADAAVRSARATREAGEKADSEAARRIELAEADLRAARDPLVVLGAPAPDADLAGSWSALVEWAAVAGSERKRRLATLDPAAAEHAHTRASRSLDAAKVAVERRREDELAAQRAEHDARGASARARARHTELSRALADAPTDADAAARLAERDALVGRARSADSEFRASRTCFTEATAAAERVSEALRSGWRELAATRDPLVAYGVPALRRERDDADELVAAWRELTGWATREAAERRQALIDADGTVGRTSEARDQLERQLADELRAADVTLTQGRPLAGEAPVAAAAALERARGRAARLDERRADATRLAAECDEAQSAHQVANMLAKLLRSNEFPRWLVASALDTLVVDASRRLSELSGGQFELTHSEGEFFVVDHADADTRRPVKTLSGGETFQASLSLALALSDQLSGLAVAGAARLDSIFLDEGFGTLDEANLELVAGTLENLASQGNRMVGVVTHVPALAERVPVRYVVSRDQRTSSGRPGGHGMTTDTGTSGAGASGTGTGMRWRVESWDPGYGASTEEEPLRSRIEPVLDVELAPAAWHPVDPAPTAPVWETVLFVDGVRRIDAIGWAGDAGDESGPDGTPAMGLFASYAAGAVCCRPGHAELVDVEVRRGLFSGDPRTADLVTTAGRYAGVAVRMKVDPPPAQQLSQAVQDDMRGAERELSQRVRAGLPAADILVVDGPLNRDVRLPRTLGYAKTHGTYYLPVELNRLVGQLAPGQRTPVFGIGDRFSWYLKLPGGAGAPWAGVVRVECWADIPGASPIDAAIELAAGSQASLGRYASCEYKDARAPQNLYPIAGLERELRRRLGDQRLLHRAIRRAGAG